MCVCVCVCFYILCVRAPCACSCAANSDHLALSSDFIAPRTTSPPELSADEQEFCCGAHEVHIGLLNKCGQVCEIVCVCVRERKRESESERESDSDSESESERESARESDSKR